MTTPSIAQSEPLILCTVPTPAGEAHAVISPVDEVLHLLCWGDPAPVLARLDPALQARDIRPGPAPRAVADPLTRYTDGDLNALSGISVAQRGGEFFQDVWQELRAVRPGSPVSYTDLAAAAGRPAAVRAAASACARNLVALVVPCHRILRRDGGLGGYAYGLAIKRALLDHETRFAG